MRERRRDVVGVNEVRVRRAVIEVQLGREVHEEGLCSKRHGAGTDEVGEENRDNVQRGLRPRLQAHPAETLSRSS